VVSSYSQALPPNSDSQLFGAEPSGFGSRQMYQSALGYRVSFSLR